MSRTGTYARTRPQLWSRSAGWFIVAFLYAWFLGPTTTHWYGGHVPLWMRIPIGVILIAAVLVRLLGDPWSRSS